MTLHELFDVKITDAQIEQLRNDCITALDEMSYILKSYNAPEEVKTKLHEEIAHFDEYVKQRCQLALECGRGIPIQDIAVNAYLVEVKGALFIVGLNGVHYDIDEDGNETFAHKEIFFEVDEEFNLCAGISGCSETGEPVKDVFKLGVALKEDSGIPFLFQDLYTELLIDAIYKRGESLTNEGEKPRTKPEINADICEGRYGDDLYKFIDRFRNKEWDFPVMDAVLTGKGGERTQSTERRKTTGKELF